MEDIVRSHITHWFAIHKRELPWRETKDPYIIWLTEVIMHQTRIEQGMPYYHSFVARFPTVFDLALAQEDEVIKLWQGLGYYSRARNLHATAKQIVEKYQGIFPSSYTELISLKGIGDYTASLILSVCFNQPHAVVDGNVYRVISRLWGIEEEINSSQGQKMFKQQAQQLLHQDAPGEFNEAMMDFGAMVCTPKQPACISCPMAELCIANRHHLQFVLPRKKAKNALRIRYLHYVVISDYQSIWLQKREEKDIWRNLYHLPLVEVYTEANCSLQQLSEGIGITLKDIRFIKTVVHILSHQKLVITFYMAEAKVYDHPYYQAIPLSTLSAYAVPKPIAQLFGELPFLIPYMS